MKQAHSTVLDDPFLALSQQVQRVFTARKAKPLFRTDVTDLFDLYLASFDDPTERQYHNCSCCRSFLNRYGSLATIENGALVSAMFGIDESQLPALMQEPVRRMRRAVESARVVTQFYSRNAVWGTPQAGGFDHFHVSATGSSAAHSSRTQTPGQRMAERAQDFDVLRRSMIEFHPSVFDHAVSLLTAATLSTDKFLKHVTALAKLAHTMAASRSQRERDLTLWTAVAEHESGFSRVRSSALGTLLADLAAGKDDALALAAFKTMVDPFNYMRATTAPKAGNINRAEKLFADLGLAPALARRQVALSEVAGRSVWSPSGAAGQFAAPAPAGVFSALKTPAGAAAQSSVQATMTWERFVKAVLHRATHIQLIPAAEASYGALTTAVDPSAPPLFLWDRDDDRNPFSWYRWTAIESREFGVTGPTDVLGVIPLPNGWNASPTYPGALLVLAGADDGKLAQAGVGLFPDLLRQDLREVRSTIWAQSLRSTLAPVSGQKACGLVLRQGFTKATLRVTVGASAMNYFINDWA